MKAIRTYIIAAAAAVAFTSNAQEAARSAYFLDGYSYRHMLNPALGNDNNYVSIPALGNVGLGMASNVGVNTFLYKTAPGSQYSLTTFMSPTVDAATFLNKLGERSRITADVNLTVLSAGFKAWKGYNTVTIGVRTDIGASLPKDLFRFMKLGQTGDDTRYSFKNLALRADAMAEIAFGHSRNILPGLEAGAKLKFLLGIGGVSAKIDRMDVRMSGEQWLVNAKGSVDIAAGSGLYLPTKQEAGVEYDNADQADLIEWGDMEYNNFGLSGFGMAIDLGATYDLPALPGLQLSAALTDIGFISYSHAVRGATSDVSWTFDGFSDVAFDKNQPGYQDNKLSEQIDNLWDDLEDVVNFHRTASDGSFSRMLGTTLRLGAEYKMPFYQKLTGAFLFSTRMAGVSSWTEGRFYANVKPTGWFDASVNYGAGTFGSSFGWMINFHPRGFNFFIGSDHQFFKVTPQFLPVGRASAQLNIGFNVTY
ncbi:MAG: hypothetical protein K2I56_04585 [Muribaculaceae bacterium]|nr:hypothetical protein [Muribaculaceae bacterium]